MDLARFLSALVGRWYLVVLFVAAGVLGTWCYFWWFGQATASASVAVLEPAVTRATNSQQAQFSFNSIAESYTVAERVIQRLGLATTAQGLKGRISVKLSRSLVNNVATPLYVVQAQDPDPNQAVAIANAVVDEARQLFIALNAVDPAQIDAAFQPEERRLTSELTQARRQLIEYEEQNRARLLPERLDDQRRLVGTLRQGARQAEVENATSAATRAEAEKNYAGAVAEELRLRALQPEYDRLVFDVSVAANVYQALAPREGDVQSRPDVNRYQAEALARAGAAKAYLDQSRDNLTKFQQANGSADLTADIAAQTELVNQLRREVVGDVASAKQDGATLDQVTATRLVVEQARSAVASAEAERDYICNQPAVEKFVCDSAKTRVDSARARLESAEAARRAVLNAPAEVARDQAEVRRERQARLEAEEAKLTRLRGLQPEFQRLSFEVNVASSAYTQIIGASAAPIQQADLAAVRAEVQGRVNAARDQLNQARAALADFQRRSNVADLPSQIQTISALSNELRRQVLTLRSPVTGYDTLLADETKELDRLTALLPRHQELSAQIGQLGAQLSQLQARKLDTVINGTLAPATQIKLLDAARIQPDLLWTLVLYILGVVLGLFVGILAVYLSAYFDRTPRTEADVRDLIGVPVLTRVPSA